MLHSLGNPSRDDLSKNLQQATLAVLPPSLSKIPFPNPFQPRITQVQTVLEVFYLCATVATIQAVSAENTSLKSTNRVQVLGCCIVQEVHPLVVHGCDGGAPAQQQLADL